MNIPLFSIWLKPKIWNVVTREQDPSPETGFRTQLGSYPTVLLDGVSSTVGCTHPTMTYWATTYSPGNGVSSMFIAPNPAISLVAQEIWVAPHEMYNWMAIGFPMKKLKPLPQGRVSRPNKYGGPDLEEEAPTLYLVLEEIAARGGRRIRVFGEPTGTAACYNWEALVRTFHEGGVEIESMYDTDKAVMEVLPA